MKHVIVGVLSAIALVAAATLAVAQPAVHSDSPKAALTVAEPLTVGAVTLKPGDYTFRCRHIGDKDMLVITNDDNGKEIVRVPCQRRILETATQQTVFTTVNVAGSRVLKSLRIKGEAVEHIVVTD